MRTLPENPNLDQLKRQARELLNAFKDREPGAANEIKEYLHGADPTTFALHDAQFVLARSYGFASWPKLKAYLDGHSIRRLVELVKADDAVAVTALLKHRSELARMSVDNMQPIHFAVMNGSPEMVRLLLKHGANPREGVYPHREATTARAIAVRRGYEEIVRIIDSAPVPEDIFRALVSRQNERAVALIESDPELVHAAHPVFGWRPLHLAAKAWNADMIVWLIQRGADPNARAAGRLTALDVAAIWSSGSDFANVAEALLAGGAELTPRAAAALGLMDYSYGANLIEDRGGLLRIAVTHDRRSVLELLLDRGFDPNERTRLSEQDEAPETAGMPLWECASTGKHQFAELLLGRGADPNAMVYASGTPLYQAYAQRDERMIALLMRYGGKPDETLAGLYRLKDVAETLLRSGCDAGQLLWAATCGGDSDIVRMTLEHIDWPRDHPRWFSMMEQAIRVKEEGGSYLECFRMIVDRCDPNLRGRPEDKGQFGLTMLHSIAGARSHVSPEERLAFATVLLDAGARLDVRDNLLQETALGWARRYGRDELVDLFIERGAEA